jgi:hypothetical protein
VLESRQDPYHKLAGHHPQNAIHPANRDKSVSRSAIPVAQNEKQFVGHERSSTVRRRSSTPGKLVASTASSDSKWAFLQDMVSFLHGIREPLISPQLENLCCSGFPPSTHQRPKDLVIGAFPDGSVERRPCFVSDLNGPVRKVAYRLKANPSAHNLSSSHPD